MEIGLSELVVVLTIVSGMALLVIGILVGILLATFAPRRLERLAVERQARRR